MISENILLAVASLKANKMRALLTMLGIIIGIASVIAIVTIGNAMTASVNSNLSAFNTNNISVYVQEKSRTSGDRMMNIGMLASGGPVPGGGGAPRVVTSTAGRARSGQQSTPQETDLLSMSQIEAFEETHANEIAAISLEYSAGSAQAKSGDLYANVSVVGTNPGYAIANSITMLEGRFLMDKDIEKARNVVVVSDKFVNNMFKDGTNPISQEVKLYKSKKIELYTIIGVYKYEASPFARASSTASEIDISTNFYIPISTAKQDILSKNYANMTVVAAKNVDVIAFTTTIKDYFADIYKNNATFGITASNMEAQLNSILDTIGTISIAIAFIAAISLVVGGIGVMNIMLVSVTERTREIGTRKALGAKNYHIRLQFITEAVIISGIGGFVGVVLGSMIGAVVSVLLKTPVTISFAATIISVIFSMVIGIFFGYYPANKAAKLDPIEALRYE